MDFKDKVAIVTGAGQGIGFEICNQLAKSGAVVYLNDIDEKLAENAANAIEQAGGRCNPYPGDSSDLSFIESMVAQAYQARGQLDMVVANAGITLFGDFLTYPAPDFQRVVQVNLFGTFFLAQVAARYMKEQAGGGSMLFTSSVTGHQAHKNLAAYGMTKAAIEMLAKNLVIELSPFKINVNALAPGATVTERTGQEADYEAIWSKITPMGRPAYAADIAHAALFLLSEQARHITGQTLIVDGGWTSISPSPYESDE
jgi:NAD(P)-dependent dehydrogenase (short-subunit alcohol dehydrogenase family)